MIEKLDGKLFHPLNEFKRQAFDKRMREYGFKNKVPSVLTEKELQKESAVQEIKVEFFTETNDVEISKVSGKDLFAISSELKYNILPLDNLFADKLTTLGPNTIGVQDDRMDEQIKQLYDIWMLLTHHLKEFHVGTIKEKYFRRAKLECTNRNIPFDPKRIKADIFMQLHEN